MQTVIDEFTRQCLAIVTARKLKSDDVLHCLTGLFALHGPPEHIRSDNGSEFTAKDVRRWLARLGVQTLFIEPEALGKRGTKRASIRSCAASYSGLMAQAHQYRT
jgi:transposase InsO family protein